MARVHPIRNGIPLEDRCAPGKLPEALTDDSSLLASGEKVQYLAQLVVQGSGHVSAMIKTDSTLPGCANNFADLLRGSLGNL